MRTINKIWYDTRIISDPEKNYAFMLYKYSNELFFFMPMDPGLIVPQCLTYEQCLAINKNDDNFKHTAEKEEYSENILRECVMAVINYNRR